MTGIRIFDVPVEHLAYWVLGAFLFLMILGTILSWANNRRIRRKVHRKYQNLDELGEQLLAYVADKTSDRFDRVPLTKFWRKHKARPSVRYVVINDLVDEGFLKLPKGKEPSVPAPRATGSTSQNPPEQSVLAGIGSDLGFILTHWFKEGFCVPPSEVILTEKQWERARNQERPPGISMGPNGQIIWQQGSGSFNGNIAGRNIKGSTQKNTDKSRNTDNSKHVQVLRKLHIALLDDATRMPDDNAAKVREMAKDLDDALDASDGTRDGRLNEVLKRIQDATAFAGGMMTSTAQILTSIKDMGAAT